MRAPRVIAGAVAGVGLAAWAVFAVRRLAAVLADPTPLTPYKEPQWWLDYDAGFVRRGLPGEVLSWVAGGAPTRALVADAGLVLTLAAAVGVVPLAVALGRQAPARSGGLVAAAVVVTSPLTVSLLLHDVGRYDGVGVLALALLAVAPGWGRLPPTATGATVAVVVAAATAAQELLLPALAPVALARVGRSTSRAAAVLALVPAAGVAAVSALLPAPAAVADARAAAAAAGVPPQGGWGDALDAVDRSALQNVAFFAFFDPGTVAVSALLWAGLYAVTALVLARLLGQERDRAWWAVAGWHAACAVGLSVLGVDFRRWWGLALLGLVAAAVLLRPVAPRSATAAGAARPRPAAPPAGAVVTASAVLLVLGAWAGDLPVFPVVPEPVDRP